MEALTVVHARSERCASGQQQRNSICGKPAVIVDARCAALRTGLCARRRSLLTQFATSILSWSKICQMDSTWGRMLLDSIVTVASARGRTESR